MLFNLLYLLLIICFWNMLICLLLICILTMHICFQCICQFLKIHLSKKKQICKKVKYICCLNTCICFQWICFWDPKIPPADVGSFTRRVNPGSVPVTYHAQKIHGISTNDLADEAPFSVVGPAMTHFFNEHLRGRDAGVLVSHNTSTDLQYLPLLLLQLFLWVPQSDAIPPRSVPPHHFFRNYLVVN